MWFYLHECQEQTNLQREKCSWLPVAEGRGMESDCIWVWGDENVLELDSDENCTTCEYTKNHWIVFFKRVDLWYMKLHFN